MDNIEKSLLAFKLLNTNLRFINITYSGGGDDGAIESVIAFTLEEALELMKWESLPQDYLSKLEELPSFFTKDEHGSTGIELDDHDDKIIEEISYEYLNNIEDWYNNEGGYGKIVVDMKTDDYYINNNVYYAHTESYKHTGSFLSSS